MFIATLFIIAKLYTHGWFVSMYGESHYNIVISLQLKLIN